MKDIMQNNMYPLSSLTETEKEELYSQNKGKYLMDEKLHKEYCEHESMNELQGDIYPGRGNNINILKQSHLRDAAWFIDLFQPCLGQIARKRKTSKGKQWSTIKEHLTHTYLQNIIREGNEIGYYSSTKTPVIGLDIDALLSCGKREWNKDGQAITPISTVPDLYNRIIQSFQLYPSIVLNNPRGLHVYYLLDDPMHYEDLKNLTEYKIGNIPVEYKPTPTTTLQVPIRKWILDPTTLKRLYLRRTDVIDWESIPIYSREQLFTSIYPFILRGLNHEIELRKSALDQE